VIKPFSQTEKHFVDQIKFEAVNEISNGYVKVTKFSGNPAPTSPAGKPFVYLNIETINFQPAAIKNIELKFYVDKSWLAANGFSANDVVMREYKGGKWVSLKTSKIGDTPTQYLFKATLEGFSYFAVSAEKKQAGGEETAATSGETIPEAPTESGAAGQPAVYAPPIKGETLNLAYLAILVIAVLAIIGYWSLRKAREKGEQEAAIKSEEKIRKKGKRFFNYFPTTFAIL